MPNRPRPTRGQLLGALLLGAWLWWAFDWAVDLATVAPIHWGLVLPQFVVEGVPAGAAAVVAVTLVLGRASVRPWLLVWGVTTIHAVILTIVAPEIHDRYRRTLRQTEDILRERGADPPRLDI